MQNNYIEASKQLHKETKEFGAASEYSEPKSMKYLLTIPNAVKASQEVCPIQSLLDHGTGQGGLITTLKKDKDIEINAEG